MTHVDLQVVKSLDLQAVRRRLNRVFDVYAPGWEYEKVYPEDASHMVPRVVVRVLLRGALEDTRFRFEVSVEPPVFSRLSAADATQVSKWMSLAARKARWAEDFLGKLSWSFEEVQEKS